MNKERLRESVRIAIDNLLFEACGCGGSPETDMEEIPLDTIPWVLSDEDPISAIEPEPHVGEIGKSEAVDLILQMSDLVNCPMTSKILMGAANRIMSLAEPEMVNFDPGMLSGDEQFMDDHMGEIRDEELLDTLISPGGCGG